MQFGVVDASNTIISRSRARTPEDKSVDRVVATIVRNVRTVAEKLDIKVTDLGAVGIAAAGAIDMPRGIILEAPNFNWIDVPLRDLLEHELGMPVVLDNDVNGATWGEYKLGAGRGAGDVLGVWIGTGIGGGLVLNGRLHRGEFFTAAEIGNTIILPQAAEGRRRLEHMCSRTGMRNTIRIRLPGFPDSIIHDLGGGDVSRIGTDEIATAYKQNDPLTVEVVNEAADLLGTAIANNVTMLAMKTVIIGGGVTETLGQPYLDRIRRSFDRNVFPPRSRQCDLRMTQLAADSGLLGAALLGREAMSDRR
jgi:glucokinase